MMGNEPLTDSPCDSTGPDARPADASGIWPGVEIERSIPENFERVAEKFGARRALKTNLYDWTYEELNRAANAVAGLILESSPRAGADTVAFFLDNDAPAVAAIFGVLKAGKIYVPVDPAYPKARAEYILADSGARTVLTDGKHLDSIRRLAPGLTVLNIDEAVAGGEERNPGVAISPDSMAVIFYTSGSTGKPKGVVDTHRNVLYEAALRIGSLRMCPEDRVASFSSFSFSVSIRHQYPSLLCGASVYPLDVNEAGIAALPAWLEETGITVLGGRAILRQMTPNLTGAERFDALRIMTMGGDTIYKSDIDVCMDCFKPEAIMVNLASTEAGSMAKFIIDRKTVLESGIVPVGHVVPWKKVLLLDENGRPVAPGEAGEIAVKSRFLAAGYWRRPELTREKFLADPAGGEERTFLTGDLGRLDAEGRLVHLGRKDFQVKVRGYRIETAEVEQALLSTGEVEEVLVVGRDQPGEDGKTLVAYIVPAKQPAPTVTHLRSVLSEDIPEYMVPTRFVFLDSMPRTATGKADRRALPEPPTSRPELAVPYVAPRTPVEGRLSGMWSELLGISPVGVDDNFFDLGGHSLRAAQLLSRVSGVFGVDVPLPSFFASPTVAGIAPMITSGLLQGAGAEELENLITEIQDDPSLGGAGREGGTDG